jgi:hypothetical protein
LVETGFSLRSASDKFAHFVKGAVAKNAAVLFCLEFKV